MDGQVVLLVQLELDVVPQTRVGFELSHYLLVLFRLCNHVLIIEDLPSVYDTDH